MKKLFQILAGPIAFALMMLIPFGGLDTTARGAIGLLLWMLLWWIMQPVAPAVTALLPILIVQLFKIAETKSVLATYLMQRLSYCSVPTSSHWHGPNGDLTAGWH